VCDSFVIFQLFNYYCSVGCEEISIFGFHFRLEILCKNSFPLVTGLGILQKNNDKKFEFSTSNNEILVNEMSENPYIEIGSELVIGIWSLLLFVWSTIEMLFLDPLVTGLGRLEKI